MVPPFSAHSDLELWQELEDIVSTTEFCHTLYHTVHRAAPHAPIVGPASTTEPHGAAPQEEPTGSSGGDPSSSSATAAQEGQHADLEDGWELEFEAMGSAEEDGFCAVQQQDVVKAMAYHIAALLAKHPEAQSMSPKQLQQALSGVFSTMKQTKLRKACRVGRNVYRYSTLAWSAVQMYQNPFLIRAVMAALWTTSRMGSAALSLR